jgi:hypothetical protein
MSLENQVQNIDDEIENKAILENSVDGNTFYTVDTSSQFVDNILKSRNLAAKQIEVYKEDIITEMLEDIFFRNFMCANFRGFIDKNDFRFIDESDFGTRSVRRVKKFGFSKSSANIVDEPVKEEYLESLTEYFRQQYIRLFGSNPSLAYDKYLKDPLIKMAQLIDCKDRIQNQESHIVFDAKSSKAQSLMRAQQLNMIYEDYIAELLKDNLEDISEIVSEPCILTSPNVDDYGNLKGYIELDGFLVSSDDQLVLIECKNVNYLKQTHISKFLGKSRIIEDVYNVDVQKCLVTTCEMGWMVDGLRENGLKEDIGIYGCKSHRDNYSSLIEDLS